MFVNISNYPSERWSKEQRKAAFALAGQSRFYSETLCNSPFPEVDPQWTKAQVERYAEGYLTPILAPYSSPYSSSNVFHVMGGDAGFAYALIRELQRNGQRVVYSTGKKILVDNDDGTKKIQFKFVQFIDYAS